MLIMFDGPDGVGKSTQFEMAATALRQSGRTVFTTHMLGGSEIGDTLRSILFSSLERPPLTNLHLCLAIYYGQLESIQQHQANGDIVLVDRSPLSLYAYQVFGDGLDESTGRQACQEALQAFNPQKVIIYEAALETLQDRRQIQQGTKTSDYFEQKRLEYHQRTIQGYTAAAQLFDMVTISADMPIDAVHQATLAAINSLFAE